MQISMYSVRESVKNNVDLFLEGVDIFIDGIDFFELDITT